MILFEVRSLMGGDVDVDFINEQITKVTRYMRIISHLRPDIFTVL